MLSFFLVEVEVTLDQLISIAEQIRPHMERAMKIEVAPWIRDYVVDMEDLYTEVVLEKLDYKPTGEQKRVLNNYRDLFSRNVQVPIHPLCREGFLAAKRLRLNDFKIVIKGDPGMGKTTLCKKIAWDWARNLFTEYHIVFFVYLKFVKPQDVIENVIIKQNPYIAGLNITERKIEVILTKYGSRCLLILDGLDEHPLGSNKDVVKIINGEKCLDCNIIVTSRPHSTRKIEKYFSMIARVEGFTEIKAEQFASKILTDTEKVEAVLDFEPADFRNDVPIYRCPILLSFLCLLAREDDIDLTNKTMHVGEIYTRMVRCLYKKYLIRKDLSFDAGQFRTAVASIGKLALKTLLSGNPLLQRSDVIREVGPDVFDYGLLIGHEEAHMLIRDETADIFVTFPHRSLQEFLGVFFFIWMLDKGGEIQSVLGDNCKKPIFLMNPLFLQFCLWFLQDDQAYFNFENRHKVYQCLVNFSADIVNCGVLNLKELNRTYPALDVPLFNANDKLRARCLADILVKCNKTSKLILPYDDNKTDALDSILELINPILKTITCIQMGEDGPTFNVINLKASEMIIKCYRSKSCDFSIIQNHYTKLMNDAIVHLYSYDTISNELRFSYANVNRLSVIMFNGQALKSPIKLNPHLTHLHLSNIFMEQEINHLAKTAKADNFLSHLSLVACENVEGKLPVLFQSEWPHLKYLNLKGTGISERDLEFLCLTCNSPTTTLPNLTSLGLTVRDDMSTDTFCEKLFALPWQNLNSLYLHGQSYLHPGFSNAVKENKMQNLTYLGVATKAYIHGGYPPVIKMKPFSFDKLTNLRFLHLVYCNIASPLEIAMPLSELCLLISDGIEGNLSSLITDTLPRLTTLILSNGILNSNDIRSLAQAKVKGYLPLLKHLDISDNELSLSKFKCLFEGSCTWSDLLSLDIRGMIKVDEDYQVMEYMNEIVSRGYLPSLQKLGINGFENRNVHWNRLEKLLLLQCKDDSLSNIADAVRRGLQPALSTLCIEDFEGYDAEIVRTLSQLDVSCHQTCFIRDDFRHRRKCHCEI